jgi:cardiolipin synthase A/B
MLAVLGADRSKDDDFVKLGEPYDPLVEQAFARITEAEPHDGNAVRLLKDAAENYPAWLDAIRSAENTILFENYIIADDDTGRRFAAALIERAQSGVAVFLLHDWLGCFGRASSRFWTELREAGVHVRAFNPPSIASPLAWLRRDHRKVLVVDRRVGFVSGLCVADDWRGDPNKEIEPWRDTGVELRGPAVADLARAFAGTWAEAGPPLPATDRDDGSGDTAQGSVNARIIAGRPGTLHTYRLDQFVASAARRSLWLTDAYFIATTAYVQALVTAARDGVDVRLLVPRASDVPILQPVTRAGYRPLIEAGVRVFEWNGPMLHAKTAVADERWSRIGSTNLNVASWLTNWELDVTIADVDFASAMSEMYRRDLANATEIVLDEHQSVRATPAAARQPAIRRGSASRLAAGAVSLGNAAGAAMIAGRSLAAAEAKALAHIGLILLAVAVVALVLPRVFIVPIAVVLVWMAISLLARAWTLHRAQRRRGGGPAR